MNKKGLTWSNVVYAIIALIVLITLVWIFRKQINDVVGRLFNIIKITSTESEEVGKNIKDLVNK